MIRQGAHGALDVRHSQLAKQALGSFTMALNRSQHPDIIRKGQSVAQHLQLAWRQVSPPRATVVGLKVNMWQLCAFVLGLKSVQVG